MRESILYDLKWFDYRTLPVAGADLLFIYEFALAGGYYREKLGHSRYSGFWLNKFDPKNYKKYSETPAFVKLRQWADARMIKYVDFWTWAFEAHMKYCFRRTFASVFLNLKILEEVAYKSNSKNIIRFADFEFFKPNSFIGHELQKDYYYYLLREVQKHYGDKSQEVVKTFVKNNIISVDFFKNK